MVLKFLLHFSYIFSTMSVSGGGQGIDPILRDAEARKITLTVSQKGGGKYRTISDALRSIPQPNARRVVISIGPGIYREKIVIPVTLPFVTFLGDSKDRTTITGNDSYSTIGGDGKQLQTYRSASVAVEADYFIAINMIFENTASYSAPKVEQAVALRVTGNKSAYYNCSFYGVQDTLYDHNGLHYFKGCFIQGAIDFIFGHGRSLYEDCTIHSIAKDMGFITAQDRSDSSIDSGFSFVNSKVIGSGRVYLGRPWGINSKSRVIFSYTYMDTLVQPDGWFDHFGDTPKPSLTEVYYGEYRCGGPGSNLSRRPAWVHRLSEKEAQPYLGTRFIEGDTWLVRLP